MAPYSRVLSLITLEGFVSRVVLSARSLLKLDDKFRVASLDPILAIRLVRMGGVRFRDAREHSRSSQQSSENRVPADPA